MTDTPKVQPCHIAAAGEFFKYMEKHKYFGGWPGMRIASEILARHFPQPDSEAVRELVRFYEHEFYVLSNFSAFRIYWRGLDFYNSEVAYHWEKFPHAPFVQDAIIAARSAHEAFKIAEHHKDLVRADWKDVRLDIMREILRAKANQHEYVRRKLLETGNRCLVEDSWRDNFWGWGANKDGQNWLGKLWMEIRQELRAASAAVEGKVKS